MPAPIQNIAVAPPKPVKIDLKSEPKPQAEDFDKHLESAAKKDQPTEETKAQKKKPSASKSDKPSKPNKTAKTSKPQDEAVEPSPEEVPEIDPAELIDVPHPTADLPDQPIDHEAELPNVPKPQQEEDHLPNPQDLPQLALAAQPVTAKPTQPADQLKPEEEQPTTTTQPVAAVQSNLPNPATPETQPTTDQPAEPTAQSQPTQPPTPSKTPASSSPSKPQPTVTPLVAQESPAIPAPQLKPADPTTTPPASTPADQVAAIESIDSIDTDKPTAKPVEKSHFTELLDRATADLQPTKQQAPVAPKSAQPPAPTPEVQFAQDNHDQIVQNVRTQLLPHGGAMQIRLDPPELGALHVMVEMRDGVMNATFQTSNEEATRLLSHSLNQLKHVLETSGVSVERLQVQQAPKSESSSAGDEQKQQQQNWSDDHTARQEQQRKELMRRMWRKVSGAGDPLDLTA